MNPRPLRRVGTATTGVRPGTGRLQQRRRVVPVRRGSGVFGWIIGIALLIGVGGLLLVLAGAKGASNGPNSASNTAVGVGLLGMGLAIWVVCILVFNVLPGILGYKTAQQKGIEPILGLLLGLFIGWIGYIVVLCLPARNKPMNRRMLSRRPTRRVDEVEEEVQEEEEGEVEPVVARRPLARRR